MRGTSKRDAEQAAAAEMLTRENVGAKARAKAKTAKATKGAKANA